MSKKELTEIERHFLWAGLNEDAKRVHKLMDSEVFDPINKHHIYFWSALTEVLIHTRFLLEMVEELGERIPDWCNCNRGERTIRKLIIDFRNALCHSNSGKVKKQENMHLWVKTVAVGKQMTTLASNEPIESEFEDDALVLIGDGSLFLRRHIFKSFCELDAIISNKNPIAAIVKVSESG